MSKQQHSNIWTHAYYTWSTLEWNGHYTTNKKGTSEMDGNETKRGNHYRPSNTDTYSTNETYWSAHRCIHSFSSR